MSTETALGLIVPVDADAPNGPAQIGGNAEKSDALLQQGGVGRHFFSVAELTRTSATMGSFSTPIKVELPVVKANQLVEINFFVYVLGGATATVTPIIGLRYEGAAVGNSFGLFSDTEVQQIVKYQGYVPSVIKQPIYNGISFTPEEAGAAASVLEGAQTISLLNISSAAPVLLKHKNAETKNVPIEIQARVTGGTIAKVRGAYLTAHVRA